MLHLVRIEFARCVPKVIYIILLYCCFVVYLPPPVVAADYPPILDNYHCGGELEREIWSLWDNFAKEYLTSQLINNRLMSQGDTYALYDLQTYLHNLVDMARRCQRENRLREFAEMLVVPYSGLEKYPAGGASLAWICKGGKKCKSRNSLLNQEVKLTSIQFLVLAASVANSLSELSDRSQSSFVEQTLKTSVAHVLRWNNEEETEMMGLLLRAAADDVEEGSSLLFFTDRHLWLITLYAELSGIILRQNNVLDITEISNEHLQSMKKQLAFLLHLLSRRTALITITGRTGAKVEIANLDGGFWRLHADNKYSGYTAEIKPLLCPQHVGKTVQFKISAEKIPDPPADLGWDLSHARRLVHAFDAIERNRDAIQKVFGISNAVLPSENVITAFARQLMERVWNGDKNRPLFSNYWCGANGWYRVAYDNNSSRCFEGYPPYGLSDSFVTGGYASWGRYIPEIHSLGIQLFRLSKSHSRPEREFINTYYSKLGVEVGVNHQKLTQLMFWPSILVFHQE